jgi:hypothetical protein
MTLGALRGAEGLWAGGGPPIELGKTRFHYGLMHGAQKRVECYRGAVVRPEGLRLSGSWFGTCDTTSHLRLSETPSHSMEDSESVSGPKSRASLEAAARAWSTKRDDSWPIRRRSANWRTEPRGGGEA